MTPSVALHGPESFLGRLADPAARALVLAAIVGAALAVLRVKNTAVRLIAWTAVLYAALAMPLLGWMLPAVRVNLPEVPLLAPKSANVVSSRQIPRQGVTHYTAPFEPAVRSAFIPRNAKSAGVTGLGHVSEAPASPVAGSSSSSLEKTSAPVVFPWLTIAIAAYLFIAVSLIVRFIAGLALASRLLRASENIADVRALANLARLARASRLREIPRLAESVAISVPLTLGVRQPVILLPADWREWDDAKLGAVLAHELSHVARRDALTQRLSQIHRAVFWFSPLAWWLDRRLADLAEEASDEAALSGGFDRADYAKTLLGFFEALQSAPGRVWWQGVAMAKAGQAERRVDRILAWKGAVSMSLKKSIVVLIIALALPVLYLTAGVQPALFAQDQAVTPPPPQSATATPAPRAIAGFPVVPAQASAPTPGAAVVPPRIGAEAPRAAAPSIQGHPGVPTPAPSPAIAPVAPMAATVPPGATVVVASPRAPRAAIAGVPPAPISAPYGGVYGGVVAPAQLATPWPQAYAGVNGSWGQSGSYASSSSSGGKDVGYAFGYDDDGQRYVIVSGDSNSVTMSGDDEDARHAQALRKKISGDFIWFERDEKSYVIRDQATVTRARDLFKPQEELGRQQEELGKQQEALGAQQEALGKKMEEVRVKVPDMSAELDKLKAELKQLENGGTQEELGNLQSEIGELQSKIGELQSHAGDQQGKLGEEMGKLGEQQGELGRKQGELGRKQGELGREAAITMRHLLDEAITKGTAQPEP